MKQPKSEQRAHRDQRIEVRTKLKGVTDRLKELNLERQQLREQAQMLRAQLEGLKPG